MQSVGIYRGLPGAGYCRKQNKQTPYETVPVNSKRLPCSLIEKIRHTVPDCVAKRSTCNSHKENPSSYLVFRQCPRESPSSRQLPSSPSCSSRRNPSPTHCCDGADLLDVPLSPHSLPLQTLAIVTLGSLLSVLLSEECPTLGTFAKTRTLRDSLSLSVLPQSLITNRNTSN